MADDLVGQAEQITLGAMMLDASTMETVTSRVTSRDFYRPAHATIYSHILAAWAEQQPTEPVALAARLAEAGELQRVGGAAYLHTLIAAVPTAANAGHYAGIVAEAAARRRLGEAGARLTQAAGMDDAGRRGLVVAEVLTAVADLTAGEARKSASTWRPVDLSAVLAGEHEPPRPSVGRRDDGAGLFYPGRVHSIASESEAGKTWLALIAVRDELDAGNAAIYIDFEDDEGGVVGRLLALGAKPEHIRARFAYIRPEDPLGAPGNREDLAEAIGDLRPTLGIVDGVTEAMTLHGLELKDNGDIARFGKMLPRHIAALGPACVALDHVTKNTDSRGRYAIGGVHKLNGINGAAYVLENRAPFGIGRTGKSTVYVAKDRPGQLRRNALPASDGLFWLTTMEIVSHAETFVETSLSVPVSSEVRPRPTALMRRICEALLRAPGPLPKTGIEDRVTGKAAYLRQALAALVDEGYVSVSVGPHGALLHTLVRAFDDL